MFRNPYQICNLVQCRGWCRRQQGRLQGTAQQLQGYFFQSISLTLFHLQGRWLQRSGQQGQSRPGSDLQGQSQPANHVDENGMVGNGWKDGVNVGLLAHRNYKPEPGIKVFLLLHSKPGSGWQGQWQPGNGLQGQLRPGSGRQGRWRPGTSSLLNSSYLRLHPLINWLLR